MLAAAEQFGENMSTYRGPMSVVVEFQIRTETTSLEEWLDEWQKRAEDAFEFEPETTAYEACVNVEDSSRVLIFERYARGMDSVQTHMERAAHKHLHAVMGEKNMTKRRVFSNVAADVTDYGWWSRQEFAETLRQADLPLVLLCMGFADDVSRNQFIEMSGAHAEYCSHAEPETLIYSGGIALNEGKADAPAQKDELLFIMGCTDDAAVEKHALDANHVALGERMAAAGVETISNSLLQYRTTGRGYLWR